MMSIVHTEFRDGDEWIQVEHPRWKSAWMRATKSNRDWIKAVFWLYLNEDEPPVTDRASVRAELSRLRTELIAADAIRNRLVARISELE